MSEFEIDIKKCLNTIEANGTILYPTDTVWGIGCDATNEAAVEKIYNLKQRSKEKSLIVLLAEARDIMQYVAAPPPDIIAIVENFDTPTTVIYDGAIGFADNAVNENGSIAIRVTNDPFCKALIKRLQRPLVSTSANITGHPTPAIYSMVDTTIINGVDYIVQHRQQDKTTRQPSRLVKIDDEGHITVLRP
ncbi:threonylcarbamoyl-AMP synthase [Chitinophagaceae bacterium IBVUCB1]|nr:threonylcarbamoyl-AMP synthase [Chitinophagaceae bacterium IBVUCB1]